MYRSDEEMFGCPTCGHCDCTCGSGETIPKPIVLQAKVCVEMIRTYWKARSEFTRIYGPERGTHEWRGHPHRETYVIGARNAFLYLRKLETMCREKGIPFPSYLRP